MANRINEKKLESIARIVSITAIPVVLGIGGWLIQRQVQNQSVQRDYVQLAVTILQSDSLANSPLRKWAVNLLNSNSPVKIDPELSQLLGSGEAVLPVQGALAFSARAYTQQNADAVIYHSLSAESYRLFQQGYELARIK